MVDSSCCKVGVELAGKIFPPIVGAKSPDCVGAVLLKGALEQYETLERVTLAFHGVDRNMLGKIINKSNEIFIAFPREHLVRPYIGVDELAMRF